MITVIVILSIFLCVSLIANVILLIALIRYANLLFKVEENVNESLDVLDRCYNNISKISETPLFFDSLEVRTVINNIQQCKNVVLYVAGKLTNFQSDSSDDEQQTH